MRKSYLSIFLLLVTSSGFADDPSTCLNNLSTLLKNTTGSSSISYTSSMLPNAFYAYAKYDPNGANGPVYVGINCINNSQYAAYCESNSWGGSQMLNCSFSNQTYTLTYDYTAFNIHFSFTIPVANPTSIQGDINGDDAWKGHLDFKGPYQYCGTNSKVCL